MRRTLNFYSTLFFCKIKNCYYRIFGTGKSASAGFTLIEIMIVTAIMATLAAISTPLFLGYKEKARVSKGVTDIRMMEKQITNFLLTFDRFPNDLAEAGLDKILDPWGNPYQYLPVEGTPPGKLRKDHFMVPVNTDYDLYSMGKDGKTGIPFTAKNSRDDIVRANNGGFVGSVSEY